MKRVAFIAAFALTVTSFFLSCKKDNDRIRTETIEVTINNTDTYNKDLGNFGDEEGVSIQEQATHYVASEIKRSSAAITYSYKPTAGYVGTDEVTIRTARGSDGASASDKIEDIKIHFTIK